MVRKSKIIVAGGSGFIGSNLISDLIANDNEVISISKNKHNLKRKVKNAKYIFHDLKQPIKENLIEDFSDVEYIINCSGYIDHSNFRNYGREVFYDHFNSLISLTSLAIDLKVKSFIHLGSSDEYGNNKSPIKESVRESPISPYALAKVSSTYYLQQCFKEGLLNTVILRPFLIFGEMQSKNRFLPYLIENCIKDREFKVTKGCQIRDYLYIKDFNQALIKTLNNEKAYGEIINIASGIPILIKDTVSEVNKIVGKGKPIYGGIDYRENESMELYADINKAKLILDWEPKYDFKKTLQRVINWYYKNA
tara:strand:+ start:621 stop:1544 length:924 start_codon:yes stop_codon:yes gene_type:complete